MSDTLAPAFYPLMVVAAVWLILLIAVGLCRRRGCSRALNVGFGIVAVLVLFVPVSGVPLWNWAFSFCPNPSLPMLGIVCGGLWARLFGVVVFRAADWRATWIFGAVAGFILYFHPLFLSRFDLYYWGWDREIGVTVVAALAVAFLLSGNRHGVLLLAALIAYSLSALESTNVWDYIIDPLYWMTSTGVVVVQAFTAWLGRRHRAPEIAWPAGGVAVIVETVAPTVVPAVAVVKR